MSTPHDTSNLKPYIVRGMPTLDASLLTFLIRELQSISASNNQCIASLKALDAAATADEAAIASLSSGPSVAKAWVKFAGQGANGACTINASYNVSGVSRTAAGVYVVSFTTPFSSANYVALPTGLSATVIVSQATAQAAGSATVVFTSAGSGFDPTSGMVACFG